MFLIRDVVPATPAGTNPVSFTKYGDKDIPRVNVRVNQTVTFTFDGIAPFNISKAVLQNGTIYGSLDEERLNTNTYTWKVGPIDYNYIEKGQNASQPKGVLGDMVVITAVSPQSVMQDGRREYRWYTSDIYVISGARRSVDIKPVSLLTLMLGTMLLVPVVLSV